MDKIERKSLWKFDYEGSCAPGKSGYVGWKTFSVGIFFWALDSSGKRLKKSRVLYRIIGPTSNPDMVYERAEKVCDMMDDGWEPKHKSERI